MENLWILFALAAAFNGATSDALTKKALQLHPEYSVAWLRLLLSLPLLLLCLFFTPIPPITKEFVLPAVIALPLEVVAYLLYLKAIRISPLSLTVPFLALTPVVLMVIPYFFLGEHITLWAGAGILLLALGSYTLHIRDFKKGIWAPFLSIRKEKGSLFMIVVAILYGITNTTGKMAIEHSSALFFAATYNTAFFLLLTPVVLQRSRFQWKALTSISALKATLWPGIFTALTVIFYTLAMSLTQVAYSVTVCRLSLLIGVVYGHFLFKEGEFKERLTGSLMMLAGFALIVLFQK